MLVNITMIVYWDTMLYTPRILLPLSSACNVNVEAAVFFEIFVVTRLYDVADVWWPAYNKTQILLAPVQWYRLCNDNYGWAWLFHVLCSFSATNTDRCTHTHTHTHTHTCTDRQTRKAITSYLSQQYNNEGEVFLSQIAMGDETCIHHFESKFKQKLIEWCHVTSSRIPKEEETQECAMSLKSHR
jgi:hypothetical protein